MSSVASAAGAPAANSNGAPAKKPSRPNKRIICCMDGTWMNSDGSQQDPSNVTRISYCIKPRSKDGIAQIIYYHSGIGSTGLSVDHVVAGATGDGISENIREAYGFICQNYEPGDEIFLLGFSRGAFTARSIASLIAQLGLLTKDGLGVFYLIFDDWENQADPDYKSKEDQTWPNRPKVTDPAYLDQLKQRNWTRPNIPTRACAVWDTVGALGIPKVGSIPIPTTRKYSFVNAQIPANIEYAYHAMALDEERKDFQATMWSKPEGQQLPKILKQCWFPGVHSSVGGGGSSMDLSIISLMWMIAQLNKILDFDLTYIRQQLKASLNANGQKSAPWGSGMIKNSYSGVYLAAGSESRTPGRYCVVDPKSLEPTKTPLPNTYECVHASVRARFELKGTMYDGKGTYASKALQGWQAITKDDGQVEWKWRGSNKAGNKGNTPVANGSPAPTTNGKQSDAQAANGDHNSVQPGNGQPAHDDQNGAHPADSTKGPSPATNGDQSKAQTTNSGQGKAQSNGTQTPNGDQDPSQPPDADTPTADDPESAPHEDNEADTAQAAGASEDDPNQQPNGNGGGSGAHAQPAADAGGDDPTPVNDIQSGGAVQTANEDDYGDQESDTEEKILEEDAREDPNPGMSTTVMPEDTLTGVELRLLALYPEVKKALDDNASFEVPTSSGADADPVSAVKNDASKAGDAVKNGAQDAADAAKKGASAVGDKVGDAADAAKKDAGKVGDAVGGAANKVGNEVKKIF